MTLNKLINDAMAISRKYTSGDIPLVICGTEVDITLAGKGEDGKYYIEINYMPTPKEKPKEVIEMGKRHDDELRDLFDSQSLRQIDYKAMFYKSEGLTTEQFEQATHNYLRRMGFTKERLEHLGFCHLVRLL